MRATRPLFRFDPGWLFVLAGLAVCAAGVLLPAQADLRALEEQLAQLHGEEARAYQRLAAHADFIDQVDRSEPAMIRRLAAAQLNLVPEGDKPVLLAGSNGAPVTEWIDNTLDTDIRPPELEPVSMLSRWASGPSRLWMFGGGMMAVFIGLIISPEASKSGRRTRRSSTPAMSDWHRAATDAQASWRAIDARQGAATALAVADDERVVGLLQSMPATVDVEDLSELVALEQQEDTVDLEEDELPVRTRTIIDDDEAWHNAATIEHASEVVVDARRADATYDDTLLWGERIVAGSSPEPAANDEALSAEVAGENLIGEGEDDSAGPWLFDDAARVEESSLLMEGSDTDATLEAHPVVDADSEIEAADAGDGPDATDAATSRTPSKRSRSVPSKSSKSKPSVKIREAAAEQDDDDPASLPMRRPKQAKRIVERKPKRGGAGAGAAAGGGGGAGHRDNSAAIPFLRYRAEVDDDADETGDRDGDEEAADDSMPSMSLDAADEADCTDDDVSAAASDADVGDDGDTADDR